MHDKLQSINIAIGIFEQVCAEQRDRSGNEAGCESVTCNLNRNLVMVSCFFKKPTTQTAVEY